MDKENIKKSRDFYNSQYCAEVYASGEYHDDRIGWVKSFLAEHPNNKLKILEIGCGRGHLQDISPGYVGCDISVEAGRYFRKPFVCGIGEALPFLDQTFDCVMSFTVLEHLSCPEIALEEMVRVLKTDGVLIVTVAGEFHPGDHYKKFLKIIMLLLNYFWTTAIFRIPMRVLREIQFILIKKISDSSIYPYEP